jgi:tRNA pseudouridine38-40 synthase
MELFIGVHDFEYFCKTGSEPASTIREIYAIDFYKYNDLHILRFRANSYLRSQIRMMVDFIMKISSGKLTIEDLRKQLNKEKATSWTLASPNGLYLSKISY